MKLELKRMNVLTTAVSVRETGNPPSESIEVQMLDEGGGPFVVLIGPDGDAISINLEELEQVLIEAQKMITAYEAAL